MLKKFAFLLFLFLPVAACSNTQPLGPGVTQAQADLHAAEVKFATAQKAVISLAQAGVLKGTVLANVKKAEGAAYAAILKARAAVDAGRTDALSLVSTALVAVLELVAMYAGGK